MKDYLVLLPSKGDGNLIKVDEGQLRLLWYLERRGYIAQFEIINTNEYEDLRIATITEDSE